MTGVDIWCGGGSLLERGSDVDRGFLESPLFWIGRRGDKSGTAWTLRDVERGGLFTLLEACVAHESGLVIIV